MAILSMANASSVKVKFDQGSDLDGGRVIKTRTYSNIKPKASSEDIVTIISALVALQKHTLVSINKVDNTSLAE